MTAWGLDQNNRYSGGRPEFGRFTLNHSLFQWFQVPQGYGAQWPLVAGRVHQRYTNLVHYQPLTVASFFFFTTPAPFHPFSLEVT